MKVNHGRQYTSDLEVNFRFSRRKAKKSVGSALVVEFQRGVLLEVMAGPTDQTNSKFFLNLQIFSRVVLGSFFMTSA